ncbi:MAG: trypsin-like peptidase domain-containing protein [Patescibacteria group bacterium]|jgi:S1-C subfamily serine protease
MAKKFVYLFIGLAFTAGIIVGGVYAVRNGITTAVADNLRLDDQEATIRAINKVKPAVVSVIIYNKEDDIRVKKGSGTGFIISSDGLIITNKHVAAVASEKTSEYRIILASGKEYYAQFIGKDPLNDLAILKIFDKNLPYIEMGDSDKLVEGMTVIAIGNTLGLYQNTVTKGIVSGLGRSVAASDKNGQAELLDNVIQSDADINPGNSGGPLIDLSGKVVGINTAIDQDGQGVSFAIPINDARPVITSVKERGRIVRARLGVHYTMLTPEIAKDKKLGRDKGAWIIAGENGSPAILADSPAEKAGLQAGDIVYEVNGIKIEGGKTLQSITQRYKPGNKIGLKILRGGKSIVINVVLDEFK